MKLSRPRVCANQSGSLSPSWPGHCSSHSRCQHDAGPACLKRFASIKEEGGEGAGSLPPRPRPPLLQERQALRTPWPWDLRAQYTSMLMDMLVPDNAAAAAGLAGPAAAEPSLRERCARLQLDVAVAAVSCSLLQWRVSGATELGRIAVLPRLPPAVAAEVTSEGVLELLYGRLRSHVEVLRAAGAGVLQLAVSRGSLTPEWIRALVSGLSGLGLAGVPHNTVRRRRCVMYTPMQSPPPLLLPPQFIGAHERHSSEAALLVEHLDETLGHGHDVKTLSSGGAVLGRYFLEPPALAAALMELIEGSYLPSMHPIDEPPLIAAAVTPLPAFSLGLSLSPVIHALLRALVDAMCLIGDHGVATVCVDESSWERILHLLWSLACAAPPPSPQGTPGVERLGGIATDSDDDLRDGLLQKSLSASASDCLVLLRDCVSVLLGKAFCGAVPVEAAPDRGTASQQSAPRVKYFSCGTHVNKEISTMSSRKLCQGVALRATQELERGGHVAIAARLLRDCNDALRASGCSVVISSEAKDIKTPAPWPLRLSECFLERSFELVPRGGVDALVWHLAAAVTAALPEISPQLIDGSIPVIPEADAVFPAQLFLHYLAALRAVLAPVVRAPVAVSVAVAADAIVKHASPRGGVLLASARAAGLAMRPTSLFTRIGGAAAAETAHWLRAAGTPTSLPARLPFRLHQPVLCAPQRCPLPTDRVAFDVQAIDATLCPPSMLRPTTGADAGDDTGALVTAVWSVQSAMFEAAEFNTAASRTTTGPRAAQGLSRAAFHALLRMGLRHPLCRKALMLFIIDGCGWYGPVFLGAVSRQARPGPARLVLLERTLRSPIHPSAFLLSADPGMPAWLWDALVMHCVDDAAFLAEGFDHGCAAALLSSCFSLNSSASSWGPELGPSLTLPEPSPAPLKCRRFAVSDANKAARAACQVPPMPRLPVKGGCHGSGPPSYSSVFPALDWEAALDIGDIGELAGLDVLLDVMLWGPVDVAMTLADSLAALALSSQRASMKNIVAVTAAIDSVAGALRDAVRGLAVRCASTPSHSPPAAEAQGAAGSKRRRESLDGSLSTPMISGGGPPQEDLACALALSARAAMLRSRAHRELQRLLTDPRGVGFSLLLPHSNPDILHAVSLLSLKATQSAPDSAVAHAASVELGRRLAPLVCLSHDAMGSGRWINVEAAVHFGSFSSAGAGGDATCLDFLSTMLAMTPTRYSWRLRATDSVASIRALVASLIGISASQAANSVILLPSPLPLSVTTGYYSTKSVTYTPEAAAAVDHMTGCGRWALQKNQRFFLAAPGSTPLGLDDAIPLQLSLAVAPGAPPAFPWHLPACPSSTQADGFAIKLIALVDGKAACWRGEGGLVADPPPLEAACRSSRLPGSAAAWRVALDEEPVAVTSHLESPPPHPMSHPAIEEALLGSGSLLASADGMAALLEALSCTVPGAGLAHSDTPTQHQMRVSLALSSWQLLAEAMPSSPLVQSLAADPAAVPWLAVLGSRAPSDTSSSPLPPLLALCCGGSLASVYLLQCARAFVCPPIAVAGGGVPDTPALSREEATKSAHADALLWARAFVRCGGLAALVRFVLCAPAQQSGVTSARAAVAAAEGQPPDALATAASSEDIRPPVFSLLRAACIGLLLSVFELGASFPAEDAVTPAGGAPAADDDASGDAGAATPRGSATSPVAAQATSFATPYRLLPGDPALVGTALASIDEVSPTAVSDLVRLLWTEILAGSDGPSPGSEVPRSTLRDAPCAAPVAFVVRREVRFALARTASWIAASLHDASDRMRRDGTALLKCLVAALESGRAPSIPQGTAAGGVEIDTLPQRPASMGRLSFIGGAEMSRVLRLAVAEASSSAVVRQSRKSSGLTVVDCFHSMVKRSTETCCEALRILLRDFVKPFAFSLDPDGIALRTALPPSTCARTAVSLELWARAVASRVVAPTYTGSLVHNAAVGSVSGVLTELHSLLDALPEGQRNAEAAKETIVLLLRCCAALVLLDREYGPSAPRPPVEADGLVVVGRPDALPAAAAMSSALLMLCIHGLHVACRTWQVGSSSPPWLDENVIADASVSSSPRSLIVSILLHLVLLRSLKSPGLSLPLHAAQEATALVTWAIASWAPDLHGGNGLMRSLLDRLPLLGTPTDLLSGASSDATPTSTVLNQEAAVSSCERGANGAPSSTTCCLVIASRASNLLRTDASDSLHAISSPSDSNAWLFASDVVGTEHASPPAELVDAWDQNGAPFIPERYALSLCSMEESVPPPPSSALVAHQDVATPLAADVPYVGLTNQGATCYQNSLLQQLFMIPAVRHFVLASPESHARSVSERLASRDSRGAASDRAHDMMALRGELQVSTSQTHTLPHLAPHTHTRAHTRYSTVPPNTCRLPCASRPCSPTSALTTAVRTTPSLLSKRVCPRASCPLRVPSLHRMTSASFNRFSWIV